MSSGLRNGYVAQIWRNALIDMIAEMIVIAANAVHVCNSCCMYNALHDETKLMKKLLSPMCPENGIVKAIPKGHVSPIIFASFMFRDHVRRALSKSMVQHTYVNIILIISNIFMPCTLLMIKIIAGIAMNVAASMLK